MEFNISERYVIGLNVLLVALIAYLAARSVSDVIALRLAGSAAQWTLTDQEVAGLDEVSALPLAYPYWHQRKFAGDRNPAAHEANLYDIDAKYGDVISLAESLSWLAALPTGSESEAIAL